MHISNLSKVSAVYIISLYPSCIHEEEKNENVSIATRSVAEVLMRLTRNHYVLYKYDITKQLSYADNSRISYHIWIFHIYIIPCQLTDLISDFLC